MTAIAKAQTVQSLIAAAGTSNRRSRLSTGFVVLDQALEGGFRSGDLVLLGGLPGVGKTVCALQWARNIAASGERVLFVCYEHDEHALLARLMRLEVGALEAGSARREAGRVLAQYESGVLSAVAAATASPVVRVAIDRIDEYSPRLFFVRGGAGTDVPAIGALVERTESTALFVDYLQKVPTRSGTRAADRVMSTAEGLKELALDTDAVTVAIVAGDGAALERRRVRMRHLRGADSLAYESDVVIMMNEKLAAVSRRHSAFDTRAAQEFRRRIVFSVEKNRNGAAGIDVEFGKDFEFFRFDPGGSFVEEALLDDHLFTE